MFNLEFLQLESVKNVQHVVVVGENDSSQFKQQTDNYSKVSSNLIQIAAQLSIHFLKNN